MGEGTAGQNAESRVNTRVSGNKVHEYGLIHREQFNEIPPHVEYSLTEMGRDLLPVFYSIMNWGFKHEKELYGNTKDK